LPGNAGGFEEADMTWQLFKLSYSVRGELVWGPSKAKLFESEFLVKKSEISLFRDPEMSAYYFA
jgi:hypothetical protein